MTEFQAVLVPVTATMAAVIGLFFWTFWRRTSDRLFLCFGAAFWLLSLSWFLMTFINEPEDAHLIYIPRLLAFAIIIAGIVNKNRAAEGSRR